MVSKHLIKNRKIVLDIETTGLDWNGSDRIISLGMVELIDNKPTGKIFYQEFNPQKDFIDGEQVQIHGLTSDYLKNKPLFKDYALEILDFIKDSHVIIHNVLFDKSFLKMEFKKANFDATNILCNVICTVELSRNVLSIYRVSLDRLCKYFNISLINRKQHSALEDAKILAKVYYYLQNLENENKNKNIFEILVKTPNSKGIQSSKNIKIDWKGLIIFRKLILKEFLKDKE